MTKQGEPERWLSAHINYNSDDCLVWPFGGCGDYGGIVWNGRTRGAHRRMCELAHGPAPETKPHVAHSCDVKRCVNPKHLRWATHSENMQDKVVRGKSNPGAMCHKAVLSDEDVQRIIQSDESNVALAKRFGVGTTAISSIRTGKSWRHLTGIKRTKRGLKVTNEQAAAIRSDKRRGVDLAREYGVSQQLICDIRKHRR